MGATLVVALVRCPHVRPVTSKGVIWKDGRWRGRCPAIPRAAAHVRAAACPSTYRTEAHVFVAALAFLLHRAVEKKLKAARLDLSAAEALTALKSVRVVDIDLGDGTTKRSVTHGSQRAATVLRALGISELDPPTPPQRGETVM